jgi:hypothetical protein
VDERDLRAAFERLHYEGGPPLRLTPDILMAAGQRVRHRRVALAAGLATVAVAVVVAVPVLLGLVPAAGRGHGPGPGGAPPGSPNSPPPAAVSPGPEPLRQFQTPLATPSEPWCPTPNGHSLTADLCARHSPWRVPNYSQTPPS